MTREWYAVSSYPYDLTGSRDDKVILVTRLVSDYLSLCTHTVTKETGRAPSRNENIARRCVSSKMNDDWSGTILRLSRSRRRVRGSTRQLYLSFCTTCLPASHKRFFVWFGTQQIVFCFFKKPFPWLTCIQSDKNPFTLPQFVRKSSTAKIQLLVQLVLTAAVVFCRCNPEGKTRKVLSLLYIDGNP